MKFFDGWCFYCKKHQGTAADLRAHTETEHPDSVRMQNYRLEDEWYRQKAQAETS